MLPKEQSARLDAVALGSAQGFGLAQVIVCNCGNCIRRAKLLETPL